MTRDIFIPVSRIEFATNRVCRPTGQSSDSERALDQWQCAAVTPQVNLSFSLVSWVSKHLIEFIAIESKSQYRCLSHGRFQTG